MRRREGSIPRRGNYKCEGNETAGQEADGEMEASFFLGEGVEMQAEDAGLTALPSLQCYRAKAEGSVSIPPRGLW